MVYSTDKVSRVPLKLLHPKNSPHQKTELPRFKFKFDRILNLNFYREIPRNLSVFDLVGFGGVACSGGIVIHEWLSSHSPHHLSTKVSTEQFAASMVYEWVVWLDAWSHDMEETSRVICDMDESLEECDCMSHDTWDYSSIDDVIGWVVSWHAWVSVWVSLDESSYVNNSCQSAPGGDQTESIWISRLASFPGHSCE